VLFDGVLSRDAETDDVLFVQGRRNHVELPGSVDQAEQLLVDVIRAFQAKAHQSKLRI
jgi:hypothetical protein